MKIQLWKQHYAPSTVQSSLLVRRSSQQHSTGLWLCFHHEFRQKLYKCATPWHSDLNKSVKGGATDDVFQEQFSVGEMSIFCLTFKTFTSTIRYITHWRTGQRYSSCNISLWRHDAHIPTVGSGRSHTAALTYEWSEVHNCSFLAL